MFTSKLLLSTLINNSSLPTYILIIILHVYLSTNFLKQYLFLIRGTYLRENTLFWKWPLSLLMVGDEPTFQGCGCSFTT